MERSVDEATRFSGGDLGYSTLDVMPQAYAGALRDKPAGSTVGPFQTEGGWAVLRVEDRRKESPPTLEQARPQIVRYLTYEGVRQLLEQLRGKAKVDVLLAGETAGRNEEPASAPPMFDKIRIELGQDLAKRGNARALRSPRAPLRALPAAPACIPAGIRP